MHQAVNVLLKETAKSTTKFMDQLMSESSCSACDNCSACEAYSYLESEVSLEFSKCHVKNYKGRASDKREYSLILNCRTDSEYPNEESFIQEICTKTKKEFFEIFKRTLKKEFESDKRRQFNLEQYVKNISCSESM